MEENQILEVKEGPERTLSMSPNGDGKLFLDIGNMRDGHCIAVTPEQWEKIVSFGNHWIGRK